LSRIFHDKVGFFRDGAGNTVMFKGSMNETWMGLASDGNLESVTVACSWLDGRDRERVEDEADYFERCWEGRYNGLIVRPFPETARESLIAAADPDWQGTLERLLSEREAQRPDPRGRTLRPHQAAGLAA